MPKKPGTITLLDSDPSIIEIKCDGFLVEATLAYLPELEQKVLSKPESSLLFNTSTMDGFVPAFPMGHVDPFKRWMGRVKKIAVVHNSTSVSLAIATVKLATGTNLQGFSSRDEAVAWILDASH